VRTGTGGLIRNSTAGIGLVTSLTLAVTALGTPWLDVPEQPSDSLVLTSAGITLVQDGHQDGSPNQRDRSGRHRYQTVAAAPSASGARRTATVVLSGDLLWHDTVWQSAARDHARTGRGRAFDFDPMFAALRPMIQAADLAVCHEEVPFAAPGAPYQSYPVFAAPPEIAPWIGSMGWDLCSTASNHAVDQGYDGLVRTANLLERAGVGHVGTFRTAAERRRPVIFTTDQGVRIAVVGGTYSLNGFPLPEGRPWSVSMWDVPNLIAQARAARQAGADIVIVKYHGGSEYVAMPNAQQVSLARALTASPYVDLVVGEHAHVVQPITKVNGKWVVYGMGNAIAQNETERRRTYEGITVGFRFRETRRGFVVDHAEYVPTYWNHLSSSGRPIRIQRVVRALARGIGDLARLQEALVATRAAVDLLGHVRGLEER
jgi:poly-gamma-glutamate synthesis protein (capsule biosynthesis protein)